MNNTYENYYKNNSTFICLPSSNFGYGYPMFNTGFIYIENEDDGNQEIVNEI